MQEGIVAKIAEWSDGKIGDEELVQVLEAAVPDLESHQSGFERVVGELNEAQTEHCQELITFCFTLMEQMGEALSDAVDCVNKEDRNGVFIAGDTIARNSFQLNQAFVEFRNQALMALGPSDIPNYNLLLSRKDEYLEAPGEETARLLQEAIDSERITTYHALEDLGKEPRITEVSLLIEAFREHMGHLNKLAENLEGSGPEGDYESLFLSLGTTFASLRELVPAVQMKLRAQGDTEIPDINLAISQMEDLAKGDIGDEPFIGTLEEIEESFGQTREELEQISGNLKSALANDEVEKILESFQDFDEGIEAAYRYLEERDRDWLVEARGYLRDFGLKFTEHQNRLKEIEEQQGKVLCPSCSTANDSTRTRCDKCGSPLPQNVAAKATTTFETKEQGALENEEQPEVFVTANIAKLYKAINGVADGTISKEEFLTEVDRFETLVETNVGSLPAEPAAENPDAQEDIANSYDHFEEGVEAFRSAIDLLRRYPEDQDQETLAEAVRLIDGGARSVAAAAEEQQAATT